MIHGVASMIVALDDARRSIDEMIRPAVSVVPSIFECLCRGILGFAIPGAPRVALGVSLEEVAAAASLYFLLYGLMQPVWGISLRPTRTGASDAPCAAYRRCARFSFVLDWLTVLVSN